MQSRKDLTPYLIFVIPYDPLFLIYFRKTALVSDDRGVYDAVRMGMEWPSS